MLKLVCRKIIRNNEVPLCHHQRESGEETRSSTASVDAGTSQLIAGQTPVELLGDQALGPAQEGVWCGADGYLSSFIQHTG
jgi:hypothetical protein